MSQGIKCFLAREAQISLTQLEKIQCDVKVCQTGRCVISSEADCAKIGLNKGLTYSTTGR